MIFYAALPLLLAAALLLGGCSAEREAETAACPTAPAAVAGKAIPKCSITFIDGADMKTKVSGYLQVLFEQNPKLVGGKLPDDAFYYQR